LTPKVHLIVKFGGKKFPLVKWILGNYKIEMPSYLRL